MLKLHASQGLILITVQLPGFNPAVYSSLITASVRSRPSVSQYTVIVRGKETIKSAANELKEVSH